MCKKIYNTTRTQVIYKCLTPFSLLSVDIVVPSATAGYNLCQNCECPHGTNSVFYGLSDETTAQDMGVQMVQDQDGSHQVMKVTSDGDVEIVDESAGDVGGQASPYSSPKCPISWKVCVGFISIFLCIILILVHYKNIVELFKD